MDEEERVINLGNNFGAVALKVNGIRVDVDANGKAVKVVADTKVDVSFGRTSNFAPQEASPPPRANRELTRKEKRDLMMWGH